MIALLNEGCARSRRATEAVAERAGVGLRTVFRHFENMESPHQRINAPMSAEIRPIWERPFVSGDWKARIAEVIERRIALFERIMPLKIAADVHSHTSPFLAGQTAQMVREQRRPERRAAAGQRPAAARQPGPAVELRHRRRLRRDQKLPRARAWCRCAFGVLVEVQEALRLQVEAAALLFPQHPGAGGADALKQWFNPVQVLVSGVSHLGALPPLALKTLNPFTSANVSISRSPSVSP